MVQSIDLNAGGSESFQFEQPGATITGRVINLEELQQTDLNNGQPKFFDNGQPMMMYRVELQTQLRDTPEDDGTRSVYLKGSRKPESQSSLAAVLAAVKTATGRYNLTVGGTLTLTYIGDGQAKQRGHNPPKLYSASYQPPSTNLMAGAEQIDPATGEVLGQQPTYQQPPVQPYQQGYAPPAAAPAQQPSYQQPVQGVQAPQMPPQQPYQQQPVAAPGQPVYQQPPAQTQPVYQQPAATAPTGVAGFSEVQLAAMRAAGIDPTTLQQ